MEAFKDEGNNIVMRKPATPGMEDKKTVLLQAHMDMVPQKTPESTHNFETDPIETYIDGDWVKAKGTTLGSDLASGVASIMAVMEAADLQHGPVEALITADEETGGMFGANALPEGELNADILLNLDSETWGKFVVGSAGGIDVTAELDYKDVETDADDAAVKVTLKGLARRPLRTGNSRGTRQCQQAHGAFRARSHREPGRTPRPAGMAATCGMPSRSKPKWC